MRDRAAVLSFVDAARRRDYRAMSKRFERNTEFIVDGSRRAEAEIPSLFAESIADCATPHVYGFSGNGIDPAAWDGGVIIVSDWLCKSGGKEREMSWTFSWRNGRLWRLDNAPVVL
jgi:hypothetical protein